MEISNLNGLRRANNKGDSASHIVRVFQEEVDASLTWGFVGWMRQITNLPIFVKVLHALLQSLWYVGVYVVTGRASAALGP